MTNHGDAERIINSKIWIVIAKWLLNIWWKLRYIEYCPCLLWLVLIVFQSFHHQYLILKVGSEDLYDRKKICCLNTAVICFWKYWYKKLNWLLKIQVSLSLGWINSEILVTFNSQLNFYITFKIKYWWLN